jgi:hypothetical protein
MHIVVTLFTRLFPDAPRVILWGWGFQLLLVLVAIFCADGPRTFLWSVLAFVNKWWWMIVCQIAIVATVAELHYYTFLLYYVCYLALAYTFRFVLLYIAIPRVNAWIDRMIEAEERSTR